MPWTRPSRIRARGILGMNRRNVSYIAAYNPRHLYPRVDDKVQTKRLALEHGIAVPELHHLVRYQHQVQGLRALLAPHQGFAIKPAKGSGGRGILVVVGRDGDRYIKASGATIGLEEVQRHVSNVLAGLYSLGGSPDVAMIEALVVFSDAFRDYTVHGVPDIRTVVFRGVPVMAMMRLSTSDSDGRANLHQGAVGVGLDVATGRALRAVQHGLPVDRHPDTGVSFERLAVPHWRELLELASQCFDVTRVGYLGADIVLDAHRGPLMLELNARPGLAIQVASGAGLTPRLEAIEAIEALGDHRSTPAQRVAFAMDRFGGGGAAR